MKSISLWPLPVSDRSLRYSIVFLDRPNRPAVAGRNTISDLGARRPSDRRLDPDVEAY
jgi:hypothetical protein